LFVNTTSPLVIPVWGAFGHEIMLREFFQQPELKIRVTFDPYDQKLTRNPGAFVALIAGLFQGFGIGLAFMYLSKSIIGRVVKERELKQFNQMRISGVSLPAYYIGFYLSDIVFSMITIVCIFILMAAFNSDVPKAWVLIMLMAFANPIFLYIIALFFNEALVARNAVQYIYLFVGILIPFILPFIQLINQYVFDAVQIC